jgi:hypothetical protein
MGRTFPLGDKFHRWGPSSHLGVKLRMSQCLPIHVDDQEIVKFRWAHFLSRSTKLRPWTDKKLLDFQQAMSGAPFSACSCRQCSGSDPAQVWDVFVPTNLAQHKRHTTHVCARILFWPLPGVSRKYVKNVAACPLEYWDYVCIHVCILCMYTGTMYVGM